MPNVWIVIAGAVVALNAWLAGPGISALLGVGKFSDAYRRRRRLTA